MSAAGGEVIVVGADQGPELEIVEGEGSARAVVWPGIGARLRSMNLISLGPGARTIDLRHGEDAVYYVIAGGGEVIDLDTGEAQALIEGSMAHIDAETGYRLAAGEAGLRAVGGPAPADPALYERAIAAGGE